LITGHGAHEAWTSSIIDPNLERAAGSNIVRVELANPIVVNEFALRSHLLAGLCGALRHNESHRNGDVRLFEIGNVFAMPEGLGERPFERELVAVAFASSGDDASVAWNCWRAVVDGLGLRPGQFDLEQPAPGELLTPDWLSVGSHPTRTGRLRARGGSIAVVGEIDPETMAHFDLSERRIGWLVVDVAALGECERRSAQASSVSHFPSADVDLAFVLPVSVPALTLEDAITDAAGDLGESVRLVDIYRGRGVDEGFRSLSYRVRFCAQDRTLSESDIADARAKIITTIEASLPAKLRA
jgi:phenylalanyl-tRNA synthetase beta chain